MFTKIAVQSPTGWLEHWNSAQRLLSENKHKQAFKTTKLKQTYTLQATSNHTINKKKGFIEAGALTTRLSRHFGVAP